MLEGCLANRCFRVVTRVLRWTPVAFVLCLAAWAYYAFVYQLCFVIVDHIAQRLAYLLMFHLLMGMVMWAYFQTIFTPAARPPTKFYLSIQLRDELYVVESDADHRRTLEHFIKENKLQLLNRSYDQGVRYCPKCICVKPDRAHHCSVCGQCILKFDHHCPWVNNCIHYGNYKHFILFLGYGFLLCVFGAFAILPFFIEFWSNSFGNSIHSNSFGKFQVLFLFFVSCMFGISMGCLFFYHLYLTARNQSTVESFRPPIFPYGPDKRGFDLGVRQNFHQVFGPASYLWMLPIFSSLGDGHSFPKKKRTNGRYELLPASLEEGYNEVVDLSLEE